MHTIASLSPAPAPLIHQWIVSQLGRSDISVVGVDDAEPSVWKKALEEAEIMLGDYSFRQPIDGDFLKGAPKLRFIQQPSVGYQHIDLDACRGRNVLVANTPGVNAAAVAEHTIMLALALLKQTIYAHQQTNSGAWAQQELLWERGVFELDGKNFGIVGMGHVGREVAKRLVPFGTKTSYYDPVQLPAEQEKELKLVYKPLEHLLRLADVVSLHVPLTDATREMIGEKQLALMKFNAVLINVGRGECVDEAALAQRLRTKKLAGAGIDVFSTEPVPQDHPLVGLENVILTPHIAGATAEVRERVVQMAVGNIVRVLSGQEPQYVLNPAT